MNNQWQDQLSGLSVEMVPECLLCAGVRGVPDPRWQGYLELVPPFGVVRCPSCALRWLSPRPDSRGYEALYSDAMYFGGEGASPGKYSSLAQDRIRYWRSRIHAAVDLINATRPLKILDYGAATGEFVRVARDAGHDCLGIELSADARRTAEEKNGITLLPASHVGEIGSARFDVVHMNHVLEHMPYPADHLHWCAGVLRAGGLLILEVPQQFDNDLDRLRRWMHEGGKRPQFDAYSLHHTYFFTPSTMTTLLSKAGFKILKLSTFNSDKTPLWPPSVKNYLLRVLLGLADKLHDGGNIVEVFAQRVS